MEARSTHRKLEAGVPHDARDPVRVDGIHGDLLCPPPPDAALVVTSEEPSQRDGRRSVRSCKIAICKRKHRLSIECDEIDARSHSREPICT